MIDKIWLRGRLQGDSHGVENIVKVIFYEISGSGPGLASFKLEGKC